MPEKVNQKKESYLLISSIIYIIVITFIFLLGIGIWIPINDCEIYYSFQNKYYIPIIVFFILIAISYTYYKITKLIFVLILTLLIPVSFFIIRNKASNYLLEHRIENNISIVTIGVVKKKAHFKYSRFIDVLFKQGQRNKVKGFKTYEEFNNLSIGDTVLVLYLEKCFYINKIYSFNPTKSELKKCKNDCYLIDGKLVEKMK